MALTNLGIFGGLYLVVCLAIGLVLAILVDQRIRAEGVFRALYLYPLALSLVVTGVTWKWIFNRGLVEGLYRSQLLGRQRLFLELGDAGSAGGRDLHRVWRR